MYELGSFCERIYIIGKIADYVIITVAQAERVPEVVSPGNFFRITIYIQIEVKKNLFTLARIGHPSWEATSN